MKQSATLTSKGQITIPVEIRKSLGLNQGDQVVFEVEEAGPVHEATLRRAPNFIAMAGTIPPKRRLPKSWADERRIAIDDAIKRGE